LVATATPKEFKWLNGKTVSYTMPWCTNEPTDTLKDVAMLAR